MTFPSHTLHWVKDSLRIDVFLSVGVMECASCHRTSIVTEQLIKCPRCRVVLYCSEKCRQDDWDDLSSSYNHKNWCEKFLAYSLNEVKLAQFSFTFAQETTSRQFSKHKMKVFLQKHGVYNQGLWRRVCEDRKGKPFIPYGEMSDDGLGYVLSQEQITLRTTPPQPSSVPLVDWEGYYSWRGLSLGSPVAAILSGPLTIYYIISSCLKIDRPEHYEAVMERKEINIVLVGVEKEVDMIVVFEELRHLFWGTCVNISMVGKGVSRKAKGRVYREGGLTVSLHRAYYHSWDGNTPDIVIGLNAGIAAYQSWKPTIEKLQEQRVPAYFTDYCEYFVDITDDTLKIANSGGVTLKGINPFRSPLRITSDDNYLPWYSNGYIFALAQR